MTEPISDEDLDASRDALTDWNLDTLSRTGVDDPDIVAQSLTDAVRRCRTRRTVLPPGPCVPLRRSREGAMKVTDRIDTPHAHAVDHFGRCDCGWQEAVTPVTPCVPLRRSRGEVMAYNKWKMGDRFVLGGRTLRLASPMLCDDNRWVAVAVYDEAVEIEGRIYPVGDYAGFFTAAQLDELDARPVDPEEEP